MKEYKERLTLIDRAIEYFGGKFPKETLVCHAYHLRENGVLAASLQPKKSMLTDVCTCEEFEMRFSDWKTLYYWAMDTILPSDRPTLLVFIMDQIKVGEYQKIAEDDGFIWEHHKLSSESKNARKVAESIGNQINEREEMSKNKWFERDELPPVGEICKLVSQGMTLYGFDVEITYIGDEVGCYKRLKDNKEFTFASSEVVFSPIQSERDMLVEKAEMDIHQKHSDMIARHHIQALIDAGYRKIKQQTEDEFVTQAKKQITDFIGRNQLVKLYRAGCRFLDLDND